MRTVFLAFVTSSIVVLAGISAATAQGYPYCLLGGDFGAGECLYSTNAQCHAAASGRTATCGLNRSFNAHANTELIDKHRTHHRPH